MNPIDDSPMPPPQEAPDPNSLTRDIEVEIERAVRALIDRKVVALGIGRRAAAVIVLGELRR